MTDGAGSLAVLVGLAEEADLLRKASRSWPEAPRVIVGGGTAAAAQRRAPNLLGQSPSALLSFGYCGGLASDLKPGDLVIATQAVDASGARFSCDPHLSGKIQNAAKDLGLRLHSGAVASPEKVAADPLEKQRLMDSTGAIAVDLESAAVAQVAQGAGLPFAVLRAVLDDAQTPLPGLAVSAIDESSGKARTARILLGLLRDPGALPALIRLGRARAAAQASLRRLLVRPLAL